jgi:hypothetical protein
MKKVWILAVAVALVPVSDLFAQTGSQKFTVNVPSSISITAPADVALTHDESDNNQAFPAQSWGVSGNTQAGVNVSFSTAQAFTHTTDSSYKRDVELSLALGNAIGAATWTVGTASDTTDYANATPDEVATVAASSDGVGAADFDLSVTFITDTFGSFAAGAYETTVTGTVSSN